MTPKQKNLIKLCLVVLAISMLVMAISTVVQIIHNGWESFNTVDIVPFGGMAVAIIAILASDKKKDDK